MIALCAPIWRILPADLAKTPAAPARAPVGRFHHSGQIAAYGSLSAEGAAVAVKRYLDDGIARVLVPMRLDAQYVVDMRHHQTAAVQWQKSHDKGGPPATWALSDAARAKGAQAMLYSSRSRPDLTHVVVFAPELLRQIGAVQAFTPDRPAGS